MAGIRFDIAESVVKIGIIKASGSNSGVDNGNTLEEVGIVDGLTLDSLREEIVQGAIGVGYSVNPNSLDLAKDMKVFQVIDQVIEKAEPVAG